MLYYCSFGAVCGFAAAVATDTTTPLHKIIFLVGPSVCMWRWAGVVVCFCLFLSG